MSEWWYVNYLFWSFDQNIGPPYSNVKKNNGQMIIILLTSVKIILAMIWWAIFIRLSWTVTTSTDKYTCHKNLDHSDVKVM